MRTSRAAMADEPVAGGRRRRLRMLAMAGLLAAALAVAASLSGMLGALEHASLDHRFAQRTARTPSDVVLVAVDDVTLTGLHRQWPLPRAMFGRAARLLHAAGVRDIVFDIQFTEPTTPRQDLALYEGLRHAGGAVMATTESDGHGHSNVLGGDRNLARVGSVAAGSNFPDDDGGVIRRFTARAADLPTVAAAVARRAGDAARPRAFAGARGAYIDFRGPPGTVPSVSLSSLLHGDVPASRLRGRIAVIGTTAPSLHDLHATSAGPELMSGPEVQANAIWTLLHGIPLRDAPRWLNLLAIVALSLLVPLLALRVRPGIAAVAAPVAGLAWVAVAQLAFGADLVVEVVAPLFGLALSTVATVVVSLLLETVERERVGDLNALLEREVHARTSELRATELEIVQRLGHAVESRDEETGEHVERIGALCERLALAAGLDAEAAELIHRASAMHDVGKIAIPDHVLRKPGPLDAGERALMQRHTTVGGDLLAGSRSSLVQLAEVIARTHHERWDGRGYPAGLRGEAIPLEGRICAVCDVFDALVSDRPYKAAWPVAEALAELRRESGRHFDPRLVELFLGLGLERELAEPAAGDPLRDVTVGLAPAPDPAAAPAPAERPAPARA
jgi:CHASE2 domain-containing sensor protein